MRKAKPIPTAAGGKITTLFMGGGRYAGVLCGLFGDRLDLRGYCDDVSGRGYIGDVYGVPCLGGSDAAKALVRECPNAVIAVGSEGDLSARVRYFAQFSSYGFHFPTLVHPSAQVAPKGSIGRGTVVHYNAMIDPCVTIGDNCVISGGAIISHDAVIGDHVYIGPGAVVCGSVTIGEESFLGAGAVVIQKKAIGRACLVAASACVVCDIPGGSLAKGVPATYAPLAAKRP